MIKNNRVFDFIAISLVIGSLSLAIVDKDHRDAFLNLTELTVVTYIGAKGTTDKTEQPPS